MKRTSIFATLGISALLIGASFVVFASAQSTEKPSADKKSVHVVTLSPVKIQDTETFSGFILGADQGIAAAKTSGQILKLLKEEGDTVRQGEIIAIIDSNTLRATDAASALSLDAATTTLSKTKRYYEQKVDEADAALSKAEDEYRNGSTTKRDVDIASEALRSAKKLRDAEISAAKGSRVQVEGQYIIAQATLADTFIRAPFTGIVTEKHATLGSFVTPGSSVYSLAKKDTYEIAVSLPEHVLRSVQKNDSVTVTNGSSDHSAPGYVFSVSPIRRESTSQGIARIRFSDMQAMKAFTLGQHVRISFVTGSSREAIMIPETSILRIYDDTFVYIITDGILQKRTVTLGTSIDGKIEVLSGLTAGLDIATDGIHAGRTGESIETISAL